MEIKKTIHCNYCMSEIKEIFIMSNDGLILCFKCKKNIYKKDVIKKEWLETKKIKQILDDGTGKYKSDAERLIAIGKSVY